MQNIREEILALEKALLTQEVRSQKEKLDDLLSDDFSEFASSGEIYYKHDILNDLPIETFHQYEISNVDFIGISDEIVCIKYNCLKNKTELSLRSSTWKNEDGKWRIIFHQGTKTNQQNNSSKENN